MGIEANTQVVRRLLEEVVNTGDVGRLAELVASDGRDASDPTGEAVGPEAMRAHVLGVRQTDPDLHVTVEQQIGEGEWVAPASPPGAPISAPGWAWRPPGSG